MTVRVDNLLEQGVEETIKGIKEATEEIKLVQRMGGDVFTPKVAQSNQPFDFVPTLTGAGYVLNMECSFFADTQLNPYMEVRPRVLDLNNNPLPTSQFTSSTFTANYHYNDKREDNFSTIASPNPYRVKFLAFSSDTGIVGVNIV